MLHNRCRSVSTNPTTQRGDAAIMPHTCRRREEGTSCCDAHNAPASRTGRNVLLSLLVFLTTCLMSCSCHKKESAAIPRAEGAAPVLDTKTVNLMSVEEFARFISFKDVQLIDVRTPQEYVQGHLIGARNIDYQGKSFLSQIQQLDKRLPVAIYCRSGKRSNAAAQLFLREGFTVADLNGGIMAWQKAGKDIATPPVPDK